MRVNAAFQGKQLSLEESPCEVRKIITLPDKEFGFFKKHLIACQVYRLECDSSFK